MKASCGSGFGNWRRSVIASDIRGCTLGGSSSAPGSQVPACGPRPSSRANQRWSVDFPVFPLTDISTEELADRLPALPPRPHTPENVRSDIDAGCSGSPHFRFGRCYWV